MPTQYRVRPGFRLAAVVPTLMLLVMGGAILVIGIGAVARRDLTGLLGVAVGAPLTALGILLGRVVWTGRSPATFEEHDLEADEIASMSDEARSAGRLDE